MDTISDIPIMVNDTIEYLVKSDVVEFYTDMMDKQATQFGILIGVISGVFVLAIGATWWWNYNGAKQQIKDEVNTTKQALYKLFKNHQKAVDDSLKKYEENFNGFKGNLQKSVNQQIENGIIEAIAKESEKLNLHMDEVDKHSMQEIEALKTKTINDITGQRASLCRIFALYCKNINAPLTSISWWIKAMKNYALVQNEEWVGRTCESIVKQLKDIDITQLEKEHYENFDNDIDTIQRYLPKTRHSDKQFILKKLSEIQKELSDRQL